MTPMSSSPDLTGREPAGLGWPDVSRETPRDSTPAGRYEPAGLGWPEAGE